MEALANKQHLDWQIRPIKQDKGKDTYSADDLIDAYLKGRKDASNNDKQIRMEKLEANLERAKTLSVHLFEEIKKQGFSCNAIKLKIKDIYHFSSIFLVNEDDYTDDKFLNIYSESVKLKREANKEKTFDFTTVFAPMNSEVELNNMLADGYIFSYDIH